MAVSLEKHIEINNTEDKKFDANGNDYTDDAVRVGIRLRIDQISRISTADQQYTISGLFMVDWVAEKEEIERWDEMGAGNYEPNKTYKAEWSNITEYAEMQKKVTIRCTNNIYYNLQQIMFKGTFTDTFEVGNYPFDVQDLTFVCYVKGPTDGGYMNGIRLVPIRTLSDTFTVDATYLALPDWDIVGTDINLRAVDWHYGTSKIKSQPYNIEPFHYVSFVYFRVQVRRKWFAFAARVLLWMFMLSIMSFFQCSFDPQNVTDRLEYLIALLFAVIAFQIIIGDTLPFVPYLTIVDKYNLCVLLLIMLQMIAVVAVGWREEGIFGSGIIDDIDFIYNVSLVIIFVLYHIVGIIYIRKKIQDEKKKIGARLEDSQSIEKKFISVLTKNCTDCSDYK